MAAMSLKKFSTTDLVVITMMAALGIAIKPVITPLVQILTGPLLIPGGTVAGGFYMLWLVLGYGLTGNKPGTALLIGLVQGIIVILQPFANHGAFSIISYAAPGLATELVYLFLKGPVSPAAAFAGGVAANLTGSFLVMLAVMRVNILRLPAVPFLLMFFTAVLAGGLGGVVAYGLLTRLRKFRAFGREQYEE
ncbi:MAG: ECF transporter S component [Firmicutes bacterium]|nr:ECF transporter S component [Bacillota bacterium]